MASPGDRFGSVQLRQLTEEGVLTEDEIDDWIVGKLGHHQV